MKLELGFVACIMLSAGWPLDMARSETSTCQAVKEKAWKAKQIVGERQRAALGAQRETQLAYSRLVECRPGAIVTAGRAQRCAHAQSEVPLKVQKQLEAEDQLSKALAEYHKKAEWIVQDCLDQDRDTTKVQLSARIHMLQQEIVELKALVEQLNK